MSQWYTIHPSAPITLGNLTPIGQNSGLVGCRWPPNGHQLAACVGLPNDCQIWGPFWHYGNELYLPLPLPVYTTSQFKETETPKNLYRMSYGENGWQVRPEHQGKDIEVIGGQYLIAANALRAFWKSGKMENNPPLANLPWQTLTLSHNSRENYEVKEEGGFFAEMTTLLKPGWSIALKIIGNYTPPEDSFLGAGATPVIIKPLKRQWDWLGETCETPTGAILLTAALWEHPAAKASVPYPPIPIKAYASDSPVPWQSWKKVRDRNHPQQTVRVLTPGEWLTPAGAVYLWEGEPPVAQSGPLSDQFHRDALGYGHLWLFEE